MPEQWTMPRWYELDRLRMQGIINDMENPRLHPRTLQSDIAHMARALESVLKWIGQEERKRVRA